MIRFLLLISLILSAANIYAQRPTSFEATTSDGRTFILWSDGTWEYKKSAPQPSPTPTTNSVQQDIGTNSLPPNFAGHDVKKLYAQLLDLRKRLDKSEFETTTEYEKRAAEEKQKPIFGNLTIKDTFYLVVSGIQAEYNADLQKMKFFLPVQESEQGAMRRRLGMADDKKSVPLLEYENLYNIKLDSSGEREGIFFDDTNGMELSGDRYFKSFSAEVSLNVEEAKRLKNTTKAVILVQFEEPYAGPYRVQFQVRLIDVYFFDSQTGKILAKISQVSKSVSELSTPRDNSAISGDVLNGKAISLPKPIYPKKAKAAHASGLVTVQVTIDESGKVISARAISGHPLLQQAAMEAAYQANFTPTLLMGQPVKVTGVITYNFVAQ